VRDDRERVDAVIFAAAVRTLAPDEKRQRAESPDPRRPRGSSAAKAVASSHFVLPA